MKSKDRVTLMVCTSADGQKQPLTVIGKAKKPHCFALCDNKPPLPYKNEKNAWFDKNIMHWWISSNVSGHIIQSIKDLILRRCQYYYGLEPMFRHRPNFEALLMFSSQDPNNNDDEEGRLDG